MMTKIYAITTLYICFLFSNILAYSPMKGGGSNLQGDSNKDEYVSIARVEKDGKVGYVNGLGEEVLPVEFDEGSYGYQLLENRITVRKGENWYIYDSKGSLLLDLKDRYKYVGTFGDGLIFVSNNVIRNQYQNHFQYEIEYDELDFIDLSGTEKVKIIHGLKLWIDYPGSFKYQGGYLTLPIAACAGCANQLIGFANKNGEVVLEPKCFPTNNGDFFAENLLFSADSPYPYDKMNYKTRFGFMNIKGEWVIEPTYLWSNSYFEDGAAIVDSTIVEDDPDNKSTLSNTFLIDPYGKRIFNRDVQVMRNTLITDSLVIVNKYFGENLKFALAKTDGSFVTDFKFDFINPFEGFGHYSAEIGKDHFYINNKGKIVNWEVTQTENRDTTVFSALSRPSYYENGLACIYLKDGQIAVIDMDGNVIMPASDIFPSFEGGIIKVMLSHANTPGGLDYQYYDRSGRPIQFKKYDRMFKFNYLKL